jgi:hypothetical protein
MKSALFGLLTAAAIAAAMPAHAVSTAIIAGGINADGSVQVISGQYSASRPGIGHYVIKFLNGYSPYPTCIFMPISNTQFHVSGLVESSTKCDVTFVNNSTGKLANVLFNFVALPTNH